jgi:hypothetical protein
MNKKLYLYTTILAIVYVCFIGDACYSIFDSLRAGINLGMKLVEDNPSSKYALKSLNFELLDIHLAPVEGTATFPSKIVNETTGENMAMEIRNAFVFFTKTPNPIPVYIHFLKWINPILTLLLFALFIYLPIKAFQIIQSISKEEFYNIKNINKLRNVSFSLLAMFIINFVMNVINNITVNFYVQIQSYKTSIMGDFNYAFLSLGLVLLILSEILRYTTRIKEENDLTV